VLNQATRIDFYSRWFNRLSPRY